LRRLAQLGCDTAQGFIISEPLTVIQMGTLLDGSDVIAS
jgi:EAL domain-containing protein (putative c-di-GMP-specific phosphodiesterase class I)